MATIDLHHATSADLDRMAAIHEAAATDAYRHIFPADAPFPREQAREEIASYLSNPESVCYLATHEGSDAGFVAAGPADDATLVDAGQIRMLHVHPTFQGLGIGSALLAASLASMARHGYRRATLWVLVDNKRARRFYERRGWLYDGGRRIEDQHAVPLSVLRYARDVAAPDPAVSSPSRHR